jgi:Fe-S oxidoreductase
MDHVYLRSYRFAKICPSITRYSFDAYSGQGRLDIALAMMDGKLSYTPRLLDIIYKCTLCGACDTMCKRGVDLEVLLTLEALRIKSVEDGKGPMPEHKELAENVKKTNNIYGELHDKRLKWMPRKIKAAKKADVIYFVGCAPAYRQPEIAQATVRILDAAGSEFMIMHPDEWCCGNPLYGTGQVGLARKLMEHNLKAIKASGASKVITSCSACYKTLKVDYPKLLKKSTEEMDFEVVHITEHASQLVESGALKFKELNMKVTYHDPCQLGRLSEPWIHWEGKRKKFGVLEPPKKFRRGTYGIYEPPRDILKNIPGVELVEMERIKENAWCCGAGGGVRDAFRDFALWTAEERLEEAESTGAEAIVTCCPFCKENFNDAMKTRKEKMEVYDITEIMLQAISKG